MNDWREVALQNITGGFVYSGDKRIELSDKEYIEWFEAILAKIKEALMTDEEIEIMLSNCNITTSSIIYEQRNRIQKAIDGGK